MPRFAQTIAVLLALAASPALACPTDAEMDMPWAAEVFLEVDDGIDPFTVSARGVGSSPLRTCGLEGEGLAGYDGDGLVDERPEVVLNWEGGAPRLAVTAEFAEDTLLLIRDPRGRWHFNDNGRGQNPLLVFEGPPLGAYAIYVGTHGTSTTYTQAGHLIITLTGP